MLTLVSFYSTTCGPCKALKPSLYKLDEEDDGLILTLVNISDNPGLVQEHFVRAIPTMLLFKDGVEVSRKVGAVGYEQLKEWVNEFRNLQPAVLPNTSSGVPGSSTVVLYSTGEQNDAGEGSD